MDQVINILNVLFFNSIAIVIAIIGIIVAYGLIFGIIERAFRNNLNSSLGYGWVILTAPGVIIHELSHYLMCKLFFIEVKEVKLFRPKKARIDGCLGYVSYKNNHKNIFQSIGLFFIGVAPILIGTLILAILLRILLPDVFNKLINGIYFIKYGDSSSIIEVIRIQYRALIEMINLLFTKDNLSNISFWIFLYLSLSISANIGLSVADIKGALRGLAYLFVSIFIVTFFLLLFKIQLISYLDKLYLYNTLVLIILNIGLCLSLINLVLSYIFRFIFGGVK